MDDSDYSNAAGFLPINQKKGVPSHEHTARLREVWSTRCREAESPQRGSLDSFAKQRCAACPYLRVMLDLAKKLCLSFFEKASFAHSPVILRAFAKTSSAGMSLASPRS